MTVIELNYLALIVSAAAAFVLSTVWYIVFGSQRPEQLGADSPAAAETTPPPWKILVELLRSTVVAVVLSGLVTLTGIDDVLGSVVLAFALWVAFPVVLLTGSVIWENVPPKLALIHAGDWLFKLLLISVIITVWR